MAEKENGKGLMNCGASACPCGGCHGHHHGACTFFRWLLGVLIILIVFGLGMKIGEFKGLVRGGDFGYGGYGRTSMFGYPQQMMNQMYRMMPGAWSGNWSDLPNGASGQVAPAAQ